MMKKIRLYIAVLLMGLVQVSHAQTLLFDASLGTLPVSQSWLIYGPDFASETLLPNGVNYNISTATSSGLTNIIPLFGTFLSVNGSFPTLDRSTGYTLAFQSQVITENHNTNDRAGFSIILLSSDKLGVEIAFWEDEVWTQLETPLFTHGEGSPFDTTSQLHSYELSIFEDDYLLKANGYDLLSGNIKDYSAFGDAPYVLSNYLFLGDDTSSAGIDVNIGDVSITTNTGALISIPVPPPFFADGFESGDTSVWEITIP